MMRGPTEIGLSLRPGDVVGDAVQPDRFVIRQQLGRGAMGRVFRATDTLYEREVALKFLTVGRDQADRALAIHEAKALARIRHPNVMVIYEVLPEGRRPDGSTLPPFLVTEYVEGVELQSLLGRKGRELSLEQRVRVMRAVAAALVACHRARVMHRDIKPANIMLTNDGGAKLIDFGVAERESALAAMEGGDLGGPTLTSALRGLSSSPSMTPTREGSSRQPSAEAEGETEAESERPSGATPRPEAGQGSGRESDEGTVGTPYYLAPEIWRGERVDERADIFAFGVTFFRVFTYRYPAEAKTVADLRRRMLSGVPLPGVREMRPEVPAPIAEVIDKALCLDRSQRIQGAEELRQAVDQAHRQGARLLPEQPYVGLRAFDSGDQGVFFGREAEVLHLVSRLQTERVLTLVGESGAGKSSLALAGVGPSIASGELDDRLQWEVAHVTPGRAPMEAISQALAEFLGYDSDPGSSSRSSSVHGSGSKSDTEPTSRSGSEPSSRSGSEPISQSGHSFGPSEGVQKILAALKEDPVRFCQTFGAVSQGPPGRRSRRASAMRRGLLLVLDQVEELLTICMDEDQREAVGQLVEAVRTSQPAQASLRILLTVRDDYVARLAAIPGMGQALEAIHLVRPLDGVALRAAVTAPARAFGFRFETEAMVDAIIGEVAGRTGALPLLQFALERLWAHRDEEKQCIPGSALESLGGVGPSLASFAEEIWEQLARDGEDTLADQVLLALITPDGTKRTRSLRELRYGVGSDERRTAQVLGRLQSSRLIVGSEQGLELAHEALVTHWSHLGHLVERTRSERELAEEAHRVALRWEGRGKPSTLLWRGPDVRAAVRLFPPAQFGRAHEKLLGVYLSPEASRFIYASYGSERRRVWSRRLVLAVLLLLVPIAAATVFFLVRLTHEKDKTASAQASAEAQRDRAERAASEAKIAAESQAESARIARLKEREAKDLAKSVKRRYDQLELAIKQVLSGRQLDRSAVEQLARLVMESRDEVEGVLQRLPKDRPGWGERRSQGPSRTKPDHDKAVEGFAEVDLSPELRRTIRNNLRQIQYCYQYLGKIQRLHAKDQLAVQISISPSGEVTHVRTLQSTLDDQATEKCILERIRSWRFIETPNGHPGLRHVFSFTRDR